jgi:cell division protein FtsB
MNPIPTPNLPTDNLYKFYAISGLVIILFTFSFGVISLNNFDESNYKIVNSLAILKVEIKHIKEDTKFLKNETDKLEKETEQYTISKKNEYNKAKRLKNEIFFENRKTEKLIKLNELLKFKRRKHELKIAEISSKNKELKGQLNGLNGFTFIGGFLLFSGICLSFIGFKKWKTKVQNLIDRKLEIELILLEEKIKSK